MIIENRELFYELKDDYPEFFGDKHVVYYPARACGKTLLCTAMAMMIDYTHWFIHKLENSSYPLTRDEYENGLRTIEKLIWEYHPVNIEKILENPSKNS